MSEEIEDEETWEDEGGSVREPRTPNPTPNEGGAAAKPEQEVDVAAGFIGSGSCWYF